MYTALVRFRDKREETVEITCERATVSDGTIVFDWNDGSSAILYPLDVIASVEYHDEEIAKDAE